MPFDESMFAEGQTMNMYWDQELRNRTKAAFEPVVPKIVVPEVAPEPEKPVEPVEAAIAPADSEEIIAEDIIVSESVDDVRRDELVYPKSVSTTAVLWIIVGVTAALLLLIVYLRTTKKLRF